jgi:hypothetical protein
MTRIVSLGRILGANSDCPEPLVKGGRVCYALSSGIAPSKSRECSLHPTLQPNDPPLRSLER